MDAASLHCPNCGANLGAPQGGEYLCAYCGHRSLPPETPLDQALQDQLVARALARQDQVREARFARKRDAAEDSVARKSAAEKSVMREGLFRRKRTVRLLVRLLVAGSFLWILGWLGIAACWALSAYLPGSIVRALPSVTDDSSGASLGPVANALFWSAIGGLVPPAWPAWISFYLRRLGQLERRRARWPRGRAVVLSYRRSDGQSGAPGEAVLRVEFSGRPAYTVTLKGELNPGGSGWQFVCRKGFAAGLELPVSVDPGRAARVVVDWDTASEMTK